MPVERAPRRLEQARKPTARGVRAARAWADITAQQLADKLDGSIRQVQRWEAGDTTPPPAAVARVADACGVPEVLVRGELCDAIRSLRAAPLADAIAKLTE